MSLCDFEVVSLAGGGRLGRRSEVTRHDAVEVRRRQLLVDKDGKTLELVEEVPAHASVGVSADVSSARVVGVSGGASRLGPERGSRRSNQGSAVSVRVQCACVCVCVRVRGGEGEWEPLPGAART